MDSSIKNRRFAGVAGSAFLLGLVLPSAAMAAEEPGAPVGAAPAHTVQQCTLKRIERQVISCSSDAGPATVPWSSTWVPVYDECFPVPLVQPGEGGRSLLTRK